MQLQEVNNKLWIKKFDEVKPPKFFKRLKIIEFEELEIKVLKESNKNFCEDIINNLYDGCIYQFLNAFDQKSTEFIMKECASLSKKNKVISTEIKENNKNFFYIQNDDLSSKGGYKAFDRSYYFFPWNKDSKKIFEIINKKTKIMKILSGRPSDEFNQNTPKNGVINRAHIIQYVPGGGTISPHSDPFNYQRIQLGSVLNKFNVDYFSGGFAVFKSNNQKVILEPNIKKGSLICFFPSMYHTVDPIDEGENFNFENLKGRWYLSIGSVATSYNKNRENSKAVKI